MSPINPNRVEEIREAHGTEHDPLPDGMRCKICDLLAAVAEKDDQTLSIIVHYGQTVELFRKYIKHVGDCEGTYFLGRSAEDAFTKAELAKLKELAEV